jgi:transposase
MARPAGLKVPDDLRLVFLPPYSPQLRPAERLWPLVDEAIANRYSDSLADIGHAVAAPCRQLERKAIRAHTDFHWWPQTSRSN